MRGSARLGNNTSTAVAASIALAVVSVCSGTMGSAQQKGVAPPASISVMKDRETSPIESTSATVASFTLSVTAAVVPQLFWKSGYHDSSQPWSLADGYPPAVLPRVAAFH
jgi:hypothetical protein